jgi:hypothetical protein
MTQSSLQQWGHLLLSGAAGAALVACVVVVWPPEGGPDEGTRERTVQRGRSSAPTVQTATWPLLGNDNPHGDIDIECSACHTSERWVPLRDSLAFRHNADTEFRLTGVHTDASCEGCHLNLRFDQPQVDEQECAACHVDVHQGEFGGTCASCHNTTSFQDVNGLQIHAGTRFPLAGAHAQTTCESCHQDQREGAFTAMETACQSCHEDDYQRAHANSGISRTCQNCHGTTAWLWNVQFDHVAETNFALLGTHQSLACTSCHVQPSFDLREATPETEDDCYACHADDYQEEHAGTGFPTTCRTCHDVNTWEDASFEDHDTQFFPIFSGTHAGTWGDNCQTCHTQPDNFSSFSCLTCHEHNQAEMGDEHEDVAGYVYESTSCLSCHPSGTEEDAEDDD